MATITTQTIKVDLTPGRVYPVLHVSQGDVGLEALEFYIYQNGQPYPIPSEVTAINIDGMTPVGVFSYACTWSGNVVTAGLTATMTAERGIDICELALYDSTNNKIGTCNLYSKTRCFRSRGRSVTLESAAVKTQITRIIGLICLNPGLSVERARELAKTQIILNIGRQYLMNMQTLSATKKYFLMWRR